MSALTDEQRMHIDNAARVAVLSSRQYGADNDASLEAEIRERSPNVEFNEIDVASFAEIAGQIGVEIGKIAGPEFTAEFIAAANQ